MTDEFALEVESLTFGFVERGDVFRDLTLRVAPREFVSIVGPSGCGKSTLLRLMAGLLPPERGVVRSGGQLVDRPVDAAAVVFQDARLLPWRTVAQNVRFGIEGRLPRSEIGRRCKHLLELVGLSAYASYRTHQLSGGMRQRVNLARALAVDPRILLMDEPFASLDAQTRESQQAALLDIWSAAGKAVVFVTHQVDEAIYLGDRVVVLGRKPTGVLLDLAIPLERPRPLSLKRSPPFLALEDRVMTLLVGTESTAESSPD